MPGNILPTTVFTKLATSPASSAAVAVTRVNPVAMTVGCSILVCGLWTDNCCQIGMGGGEA